MMMMMMMMMITCCATSPGQATCPSGHMDGTVCYRSRPNPATWTDAENDCQRLGGHLMMADSSAKQTTLQRIMAADGLTDVWLGGQLENAQYDKGIWKWVAGMCQGLHTIAGVQVKAGLHDRFFILFSFSFSCFKVCFKACFVVLATSFRRQGSGRSRMLRGAHQLTGLATETVATECDTCYVHDGMRQPRVRLRRCAGRCAKPYDGKLLEKFAIL